MSWREYDPSTRFHPERLGGAGVDAPRRNHTVCGLWHRQTHLVEAPAHRAYDDRCRHAGVVVHLEPVTAATGRAAVCRRSIDKTIIRIPPGMELIVRRRHRYVARPGGLPRRRSSALPRPSRNDEVWW